MADFTLSGHAEIRMNQRGMRFEDLGLVLCFASQIDGNVLFMKDCDTRRAVAFLKKQIAKLLLGKPQGDVSDAIASLKRQVQRFDKLRGIKLVLSGETVVTAYHSMPSDQARTLRRGREYK